jgi:hypothetical protein
MDLETRRHAGNVRDTDHWLGHCHGFRVDSPVGKIGFVEEVRFGARIDRPDELVIRAGLLGRRVLIVPVDNVAEIVPRNQRIVLAAAPRLVGSEPREGRISAGRADAARTPA